MKKIYILLFIVMMFWGFNLSAIKVLVANIDPIQLTAVRIFVAGISVLVIAYFMGLFRLPTKKEFTTILIVSVFNVIVHHSLLGLGLFHTSGVNASLIMGTGPLLTVLLSIIFLKDRITRLRALGFLLGFVGIAITSLIGSGGITSLSIGDIMVFLSILSQALSFIMISKLNPNFDPRLFTGYMLTVGSFFILLVSLFVEGAPTQILSLFSWKLGLIFLFSAVICTAFGHMTYNFAIKQVGPVETAIFVNLNTFFSILGATIFLGEILLMRHIGGLILILIGVFMGSGALEYMIRKRKAKARQAS